MITNGITASNNAAAAAVQAAKPAGRDGDSDGSSAAAKVGPAVALSLTNVAHSKAPDAAAGDPDHDGK